MKERYSPSQTTADIIVDKLIAWKVEIIFSLVGDAVNPIFEALRKRKDEIRLIGVRHEEAAAFMASGYAKSTGKLGVCLAISGPRTTHLLNGLYDAAMEGAPVLAITGVITQDDSGGTYSQEIDAVMNLTAYTSLEMTERVIKKPKRAQESPCSLRFTPAFKHLHT